MLLRSALAWTGGGGGIAGSGEAAVCVGGEASPVGSPAPLLLSSAFCPSMGREVMRVPCARLSGSGRGCLYFYTLSI